MVTAAGRRGIAVRTDDTVEAARLRAYLAQAVKRLIL